MHFQIYTESHKHIKDVTFSSVGLPTWQNLGKLQVKLEFTVQNWGKLQAKLEFCHVVDYTSLSLVWIQWDITLSVLFPWILAGGKGVSHFYSLVEEMSTRFGTKCLPVPHPSNFEIK